MNDISEDCITINIPTWIVCIKELIIKCLCLNEYQMLTKLINVYMVYSKKLKGKKITVTSLIFIFKGRTALQHFIFISISTFAPLTNIQEVFIIDHSYSK